MKQLNDTVRYIHHHAMWCEAINFIPESFSFRNDWDTFLKEFRQALDCLLQEI